MKNILFAWLLFACVTKTEALSDRVVVFDHYQEKSGIMDNTTCLHSILVQGSVGETLVIRFGAREYSFPNLVQILDWRGEVRLEGRSGTVFIVDKAFLQGTAFKEEMPLPRPLVRGDDLIPSLSCPSWASLVKLNSSDTVERAWHYRANDLSGIRDVHKDVIALKDRINFSYNPDRSSITFYALASILIRNITFHADKAIGPFLTLKGMGVIVENCRFSTGSGSSVPAMVSLLDCYQVAIRNTEIRGPGDYGVLLNGCRWVNFSDVTSEECLYPIVPATFTSDVLVERLYGVGSVIDAHPSFNVTYRDVIIKDGRSYWNCRALGVVLERCRFEVLPGIEDNSLYLGVLNLVTPYEFLYDEYDVICRDVTWVYPDQGFNGLHVHRCRKFIVEGCVTHAVSTGLPISHFEVIGSTVGRVYGADSNFSVRGSHFKGNLQGKRQVDPPLSGSYGGHLDVSHSDFSGYETTMLIRYLQDADTRVSFNHCRFGDIDGLVQKTYLPESEYKHITMTDCIFTESAEKRLMTFPGRITLDR